MFSEVESVFFVVSFPLSVETAIRHYSFKKQICILVSFYLSVETATRHLLFKEQI